MGIYRIYHLRIPRIQFKGALLQDHRNVYVKKILIYLKKKVYVVPNLIDQNFVKKIFFKKSTFNILYS